MNRFRRHVLVAPVEQHMGDGHSLACRAQAGIAKHIVDFYSFLCVEFVAEHSFRREFRVAMGHIDRATRI